MIRIGLTLAAAAIAGLFPAAQAGAEPVPQQFISCERGSSNQSLTIATTREKDEACTTAAKVSDAYSTEVDLLDSKVPFTVEADGSTWSCDTDSTGDTRCVSADEQVWLSSS
ncbi:hypothetical protein [Nonomuraea sp. NPDC049709]|uniref:hypothetical protein n=1 Tax=Nonomuraea sp. NPDC049709 TaxID=3154736 RepID=UPI00341F5DEB